MQLMPGSGFLRYGVYAAGGGRVERRVGDNGVEALRRPQVLQHAHIAMQYGHFIPAAVKNDIAAGQLRKLVLDFHAQYALNSAAARQQHRQHAAARAQICHSP